MEFWRIGVDEAGRGPLAGPVAVGAVLIPPSFSFSSIKGVTDSKKLSHKKREEIFKEAQHLKQNGVLDFHVSLISAGMIDKNGIAPSVQLGVRCSLSALMKRNDTDPKLIHVLLDGLLSAPHTFPYQKTVVKGDQKHKEIGLASILAKVTRDRVMERMERRYPGYEFHVHKGYGTKVHRKRVKELGFCDIHRESFCRGLK